MSQVLASKGENIESTLPKSTDVLSGSKVYRIRTLNDVEELPDSWLWYGFLLADNINLIQGHGEVGKGWLSLYFAAQITTGRGFPNFIDKAKDMPLNGGQNVLFMTSEDDYGKTVKKRFRMLGGDLSRCHFLEGISDLNKPDQTYAFSMQDVDGIEALIKQHHYKLIVFDPVQSYLGHGVKSNEQETIRPVLDKLRNLAFKYNCGILLSMHVGKSKATDAVLRGVGSVDFRNAARSVLMVGEHQGRKFLKQTKANYLKENVKDKAYEFVLDDGLTWRLEPIDGLSVASLLDMNEESDGDKTKLAEAKEFLLELLDEKPYQGVELQKLAGQAGITKITLDRAKKALEIPHKKLMVGKDWKWFWHLRKYQIRTNEDGTSVTQETAK